MVFSGRASYGDIFSTNVGFCEGLAFFFLHAAFSGQFFLVRFYDDNVGFMRDGELLSTWVSLVREDYGPVVHS